MGDITSKPLSTLRKSENLLGTAKEKGKAKCSCFKAELNSPVKLLGYTSNSKDLNSTSDCFAASRKSELQVAISNEIMVMSMQRDELKATCDTSLKNELGVSPESSPMSSGSSASYSFCDDSLQMLNEDVAGFNMGEFTRKRSYIHFPFSYPSLEELMLARIKMDYELLEKEPSVCNLDAVIATLQNDINSRQYVDEIANVDLSSACEYFEGCGSSDVEESASLAADAKCPPFEGVLKFEEGPLREWPWSDSFEQTKLTFSRSAEENISLTHHKPTQFKSFRSCSPDKFGTEQHHENFAYQEHNKTLTIIIDSERNLDTPEDLSNRSLIIQGNIEDHTMNEQRNTVSNFVADFYGVVKELSPLPVRKSWNILETATKTYVRGFFKVGRPLIVENFSLADRTREKVFPVA